MNADQVAWKAAVRHAAILEAVEARLILAGAVTEVRQFYGLSASEVDVLLWQELHEPTFTFRTNTIDQENRQNDGARAHVDRPVVPSEAEEPSHDCGGVAA